jgi:TRAP-type C4-dicarboxylate transport system substrate-binding protein
MAAWDYVTDYTDANLWLPKNIVFMSQRSFDELDEATQDALMEAAAQAEKRGWEMSREDNDASLATLEENGISVSQPNEAISAALQEAGDVLFEDWQSRADEEAKQALETYREQRDS